MSEKQDEHTSNVRTEVDLRVVPQKLNLGQASQYAPFPLKETSNLSLELICGEDFALLPACVATDVELANILECKRHLFILLSWDIVESCGV